MSNGCRLEQTAQEFLFSWKAKHNACLPTVGLERACISMKFEGKKLEHVSLGKCKASWHKFKLQ